MNFTFRNLDEETRKYMIEEVILARDTHNLYFSKRFNDKGLESWSDLLLEAVSKHDEQWLAQTIDRQGLFNMVENSTSPSGNVIIKRVPDNASETIADGQFNRFYILGVCRRAIEVGSSIVYVYRAKNREEHRLESEKLIGVSISPQEVIDSLRICAQSVTHALLKANSGLSVHL